MKRIKVNLDIYENTNGFDTTKENVEYDGYSLVISTFSLENVKKILSNPNSFLKVKDRDNNNEYEFIVNDIIIAHPTKEAIEVLNEYKDTIENILITDANIYELSNLFSMHILNNNVFISTKYNQKDYSRLEDFYEAFEYIFNIRDYIFQLNLSNLETCIFLYDILRERKYKSSKFDLKNRKKFIDENVDIFEFDEKDSDSRSLTKVYKSDEIVCAGFSKIYMAVLESLGIPCEELLINGEKSNHSTVCVYLKDDKYDGESIIEVDPTWGRIVDDNKKYLYDKTLFYYKAFGNNMIDAIDAKKSKNKEFFNNSLAISTINSLNLVNKYINNTFGICPSIILKIQLSFLLNKLKKVRNLYNINMFDNDIEEIKNILKEDEFNNDVIERIKNCVDEISSKFSLDISYESFYVAINKVKMIENAIDSNKYPYDQGLVYRAYISKYPDGMFAYYLFKDNITGSCVKEASKVIDEIKDLRLEINPITCIYKKEKNRTRK